MRKLYILLIFILFIDGCSSIQVVNTPVHRMGQSVEFNKLASAKVGDVIFSQYNYFSMNGVIILDAFSMSLGFPRLSSVKVPAGALLYEVLLSGRSAYCTQELTRIDPLIGPIGTSCYSDRDGDNRFETLWIGTFDYEISPQIPYKTTEVITHSNSFRYELLYNGISEVVIHLSYREFINDFIRPAFQQELSYTINKNETININFRQVQIEVISADNNKIDYRVLNGFKSPD